MKTIKIKMSNDIGNNAEKYSINGEQVRIQPSCNVKVTRIPFDSETTEEQIVKNPYDQLCVSIESPAAENGMYLIGRYAIESGLPVDNMFVGIDQKASHDLPIINTLANIAAYIVESNNKNLQVTDEEFKVEVEMATAIPVSQHNDHNARLLESRFMSGKHRVTIYLGGRKVLPIDVKFTFVYCTHEGAPNTLAIRYDRNGALRSSDDPMYTTFNQKRVEAGLEPVNGEYFQDKKILHIDIGDGTTELSVTHGTVPKYKYGINHGVGHALEASLSEFNASINIPDSPRQYYSDVLKDKGHKYHARAYKAIHSPLQQEISHIKKGVTHQIVKTRGEIDIMLCYGGGSIACYPELEYVLQPICEEREIEMFYVPKEFSVNLGADGLYSFLISPIFANIKKSHESAATKE